MSSTTDSASNISSFPNAPPPSPIQSMSKNGESKNSGGASKISYVAVVKSVPAKYFWKNGTWHMTQPYVNVKDSLIIKIENQKNAAVKGALKKLQKGILENRVTTEYMMEGINKWCVEKKRSVTNSETEEEFVKYVWHHMRQQQRDNAAAVEALRLQIGLDSAKFSLESHYAEFPDERKTDVELISMFRRLSMWSSVISSEQRRIASKKRHEKEEKLIHEKFCGDRGAYNRWKTLNEKVAHGRIRDVSSQLLVKFAKWFGENPDYLFPGSRDISVTTAEHRIQWHMENHYGLGEKGHHTYNADVSKEHMFQAIAGIMDVLETALVQVTLQFARSPRQWVKTDKYVEMPMHGCHRLLPGSSHVIIALNGNKLVFKDTTTMTKRLPEEYHNQLKGHCEWDGLFKELVVHKVFSYEPGLISSATISGQDAEGERYHIKLRLTGQANKTFSLVDVIKEKHLQFLDILKKEAAEKKIQARRNAETRTNVLSPKQQEAARRIAEVRGPMPPSPCSSSHKNMARELIELGKMFKDGLLSKGEFTKAKKNLL
tara:strand:- start:2770 stop:4401 length:1632 start_codon:yes stop_codon:yes gene_type:complete